MSAAPQVKNTVKFDIEVKRGPHEGLKMSFSKASVSIGRGPENDIVLSGDPRVSRQHAEIRQRGPNEFVIVNLSPKNYILVNGRHVQSELLTQNSVIEVGDSEIRFQMDIPAPAVTPVPLHVNTPVHQVPHPAPAPRPTPTPAPTSTHSYGSLPPPPLAPRAASSPTDLWHNPRARFYGIIVVLALIGWFLLSPSKDKGLKDPNAIRTSTISMKDVAEAEKRSQELLTVKKEKYDSIQYRRAQENFIKGFRDFQQGQYARARESFQVVLNLDPDNELAKRYYHLSKIKFDELVKFNMIQGNRYREKKNWRMCQSNYSNVMTMLQNRKDDPTYREAKQFYEECTLNQEGRY